MSFPRSATRGNQLNASDYASHMKCSFHYIQYEREGVKTQREGVKTQREGCALESASRWCQFMDMENIYGRCNLAEALSLSLSGSSSPRPLHGNLSSQADAINTFVDKLINHVRILHSHANPNSRTTGIFHALQAPVV